MASEEIAGGRLLVELPCDVCKGTGNASPFRAPGTGGGPAVEADDGPPCDVCEGEGTRTEPVEVMEFVRFVLEHLPERPESVLTSGEVDEMKDAIRKTLTDAAWRSQNARTEYERQEALRTAQEAAHSLRALGEAR